MPCVLSNCSNLIATTRVAEQTNEYTHTSQYTTFLNLRDYNGTNTHIHSQYTTFLKRGDYNRNSSSCNFCQKIPVYNNHETNIIYLEYVL